MTPKPTDIEMALASLFLGDSVGVPQGEVVSNILVVKIPNRFILYCIDYTYKATWDI